MLVHMQPPLTQEVQGQLCGMIQSAANTWLQVLRFVLAEAFQRLDGLPARLAAVLAQPQPSDDPPCFIMMVPNARSNDR